MTMTIDILRNYITELPELIIKNANAIYVYGSVARNDCDGDSDCDLFVCIEDCTEQKYQRLKAAVENWSVEYGCEFAFYQMSTLEEMQKKGSYFLWHIKREGVLLYQSNLKVKNLLDSLPRYTGTSDDFNEYNEILNDIEESLLQDSLTIEYDLAVLAVLVRNICIGCCYLLDDMDFGRKTPVIKCINVWGDSFPFTLSEYDELYEFRLAIVRNKKINYQIATVRYAQHWLQQVRTLIKLAFTLVRG